MTASYLDPESRAADDGGSAATSRPDKRFHTCQARAALVGATLHRIEDDRGQEVFIVTKWALTRELRDLDAVEAWLDRIEGRA